MTEMCMHNLISVMSILGLDFHRTNNVCKTRRAIQSNVIDLSKKGGGSSMGSALPSRKETYATETHIKLMQRSWW